MLFSIRVLTRHLVILCGLRMGRSMQPVRGMTSASGTQSRRRMMWPERNGRPQAMRRRSSGRVSSSLFARLCNMPHGENLRKSGHCRQTMGLAVRGLWR